MFVMGCLLFGCCLLLLCIGLTGGELFTDCVCLIRLLCFAVYGCVSGVLVLLVVCISDFPCLGLCLVFVVCWLLICVVGTCVLWLIEYSVYGCGYGCVLVFWMKMECGAELFVLMLVLCILSLFDLYFDDWCCIMTSFCEFN